MPIREYECDACGHRFERIQKFSDPPVETCPKCGGRVQKLIAAPAFQFKGTGWYITDYAKKDAGTPAKAEGDSASKSEESPKTKDAAPAKADASAATSSDASSAATTPTPKASTKPSAKD